MNETVEDSRSAIKEAEVKYVGNTAEFVFLVGKHLKNLEDKGVNLAREIRSEYSFSPERGYAFKRFYELSVMNRSVDVKTLGVDKALALLEPLKSETSNFFEEHTTEELQNMTVNEVRELSRETRRKNLKFRQSKDEKAYAFFLQAEDKLRETLNVFQGIQTRYKEEYSSWDRKGKNFQIAKDLNKIIENCLEMSDNLVKTLEVLQ